MSLQLTDPNANGFEKFATQAQTEANKTRIPHYVVWDDGYSVLSVRAYKAAEHGCVDAVRYPPQYEYPFSANVVLDKGMSPW